jgi:hypothetical protein
MPGRFWHAPTTPFETASVVKIIFVALVIAFAFTTGMALTTILAQTMS